MRKSYKFRAYCNPTTEHAANQWLALCCELYNLCLEQKRLLFKQFQYTISKFEQIKELPALKKAFPEFKVVGSQVLQDVVERLDRAFQGFFRRLKEKAKAGFPRFKGKHRYDSFTLKQSGWELDGNRLIIKNVGVFKLKLHRPIEGTIKTVTVRRSGLGHWFVSFSCVDVSVPEQLDLAGEVGIDVGLKSFSTDSDGLVIANPRYYQKLQKTLRVKQRKVSRRKKGSQRRRKAVYELLKVHEKIKHLRADFLHKVSSYYTKQYKVIKVEALNIGGMIKNKHLSKSIADASWGQFFDLLCYKAEGAGGMVEKVNAHGTSQRCSGCGVVVKKDLSVRIHNCIDCGLKLDRDYNAALNILKLGVGQTLHALT